MTLNFVVSNIVCFFLNYYCYRNYLDIFFKRKVRKNVFLVCALIIYYIAGLVVPSMGIGGNFIMSVIRNSIYAIWLYKGQNITRILSVILFVFLANACEYAIAAVIQLVNGNNGIAESYFILGMLLSYCLLLFIVMVLKKILKPQRNRESNRQHWIILILLAFASFSVDFSMLITYSHSMYVSDGYYAILVTILMMVITIVIFKIYEHLADRAELEMKTTVYEQQANIYKNQISEREHTMQEFTRLRHDMKNHLIYMDELLSKDENEKAVQYIQNLLLNEGLSPLGLVKSGNPLVDGMINYKAPSIKDMKIQFQVKVNIPRDIAVPEENLCIILGNLLDNAVEGTGRLEKGKRKIDLSITYKKNAVFIVISNTYEKQTLRKRGKTFLTSKNTRGHGIGLSSVERAVEECGGSLEITQEDTIFKVTVLLPDLEI